MNELTNTFASPIIWPVSEPAVTARKYVENNYVWKNVLWLRHLNGTFYVYNGRSYEELSPELLKSHLYETLISVKTYDERKKRTVPFAPNISKVANIIEALAGVTQLVNKRPPAWLDDDEHPDPATLITFTNGLLDLTTMKSHPLTPSFFSLNALDFAYDAEAPDPVEWLKFLKDIWNDDQQSIDTLQEFCGLLLTPDTRYQKALLIVGPKRSGKGTIGRILRRLLGAANVCEPTLNSLATNFGREPLIGKRLAFISDARLSAKVDKSVVTELLLSISGEDGQTIDRKYKTPWSGKLDTRFVIMTNELPKLNDSSTALASRFIVLKMVKSFYGKEDLVLDARLATELPSILRWAIKGWKRLEARGHFLQPESGAAAKQELEDLGSPIAAFLRDRCTIDPVSQILPADLYAAWRSYCQEQGRHWPGDEGSFRRDLNTALPSLAVVQRRAEAGVRHRYYVGVRLKWANEQ